MVPHTRGQALGVLGMLPHPQPSRVRQWGPRDGAPTVTIKPGTGGNPAFLPANLPPLAQQAPGWMLGKGDARGGGVPAHPAHLLATSLLATPAVAWQQSVQDVWSPISEERGGGWGAPGTAAPSAPHPAPHIAHWG